MSLPTQSYVEQAASWPSSGRHILAHFDDDSIVVYQAYRPSIAQYALTRQAFGGPEFSLSRMSWIKPNFLWMVYRSSWATAQGQESVVGVRLRRTFFDRLLSACVASAYDPRHYTTRDAWGAQVRASQVRVQWDPDHDPSGTALQRRAVQLGLRGDVLREYAEQEILEITDMTPLILEQRPNARHEAWAGLRTPIERVYRPLDSDAAQNVGIDAG